MTSKEQQQRLGFEKEGVVKDSHGSAAMSHEGNVESGSPVSRMQAQQPVSPGDLGFGKEGVEKDTPASAMMSHEGDVSASSPVAELQSKGATGKPALYAKEPQTLMPPAQSKSPRGIASSASLAKGSRSAGPGKGSAQRSGSAPASKSVSPGSLGFKPSGVAKGSAAATMMSSQGNVKSGSVLADLQSSGAGGRTPSKGSTAVCNTRPSRGGTSQTIECTKQ